MASTELIQANVQTWRKISSKVYCIHGSARLKYSSLLYSVPFLIRGPGIPKGEESHIVSSHHDLAPTFLALARGDQHVPSWVDGGVIPLTKDLENHPRPVSKESFAVEFWSRENYAENYFPIGAGSGPNTYKTVRVIAQDYNCTFRLPR